MLWMLITSITRSHAKTCKQRRTCMICKQSHPTGLHGYLPKKKQPKVTSDPKDGVLPVDDKKLMTSNFAEMDIECNSSSIESKIISMCVVPVKVSHSKSKKEFSTYTMLDNCSQGMFIKEDIQKKLGAVGREADITVKTLNGEESMKSTAVSGLRISSSIAGDKEISLNLPPAYAREDILVDIKEVATRENIKSLDHLAVIAETLPHAPNIEIWLLISADCAKALEPQEVIPIKNGGPSAFRRTLGWRVVGVPAKLSKKNSISCH